MDAVLDDGDGTLGLRADLGDEVRDRGGGLLGLFGKLADLLGDDGEATALLTGTGGLDRGVQREQVGLLGERGDRVDDPADLLRAGREGADRGLDLGAGARDLLDRGGRVLGGLDAVGRDGARLLGGGTIAAALPAAQRPRASVAA